MAYGMAENPALSPSSHLEGISYPVSREELARIAGDNGAPAEVINLFKSLPSQDYGSYEEVVRDFAEAARRFAAGDFTGKEGPDRRNIGRDLVENAEEGHTHHP